MTRLKYVEMPFPQLVTNDPTIQPPPCYTVARAAEVYGDAFRRAMEYVTLVKVPGDIVEFGTLNGYTARWLAELMRELGNPAQLRLFDSFEGFPQMGEVDTASHEGVSGDWAPGIPVPHLGKEKTPALIKAVLSSILPAQLPEERVVVEVGWYEETLKRLPPEAPALVHIDCDLYESTLTVLKALPLQDGMVLLFDDWNNGRASWKLGERRAFDEWCEGLIEDGTSPWTWEAWFSYGWHGQAFIMHRES